MLPRDAAPPVVQRLAYRPPSHLVEDVELRFDLDPAVTRVSVRFAYRRNQAADRGDALMVCGEQLRLIDVSLDGRPLAADAYAISSAGITFRALPDAGVLHIVSECEPAANRALEGLYLSSGVFCTQCEAEGFRQITYFQDRPDVLARFTVTIVADSKRYPVLLVERQSDRAQRRRRRRRPALATWHDPFPKPCYLFALVAGDLACARRRVRHRVRAHGRAAHLRRAGQSSPSAITRWTA